jgi:rhodanese-related sulfurtransferase
MLPDLGYYLHTYLERLRKITTIISVDVRQSDSYLNPGTPDLVAALHSPTRTLVPRLKFKSILLTAGRDLNLRPTEYKTGEFRFFRSVHLHTFE